MSETPLISAHGLHTHYGQSHILRGVDFVVGQGQTIGLMGRNGMGKTTLLKSIMGIVKPSGGGVLIKGHPMTGASPYAVARLGIAYVPEGRGIFGNLSVKENLVMAARPGTRGQRDWTYERVLETFPRLAERLNHGGQQLSGGEQQMLTIGRALMTNPDVLILDGHRRPGAADRARDLAHLRPDPRKRHQQRDRGQGLEAGHPDHRPQHHPRQGRGGVRRQLGGAAVPAAPAGAVPRRLTTLQQRPELARGIEQQRQQVMAHHLRRQAFG